MNLDRLIQIAAVLVVVVVPLVGWLTNRHRKQIEDAIRKAREEGVEAGLGDAQRAATKRLFERLEELEEDSQIFKEWKAKTELLLVDAGILAAPGSQVGRDGRGVPNPLLRKRRVEEDP